MDSTTKGLLLAAISMKVFPVDPKTRQPYRGTRGFYDATLDAETIATWFSLDHPDAEVAVWTGGSNVLTLDLDRKNGKDGFATMAERKLTINKTENYTTATGKGEHHIWQTDDPDLTLVGGVFDPDSGIDIRAGGSYFVWWGDSVPSSRDAFSKDIPDWITAAATPDKDEFTGEGFSGSVSEWLDSLPDDVLPSSRVTQFMSRIPTGDFDHPQMIDLAWSAVRMGSERETGIKGALDALKAAWLREPYNTVEYRRDFEMALRGAIAKAGRVQNPVPVIEPSVAAAMKRAESLGIANDLKKLERKVSETDSEIELARVRREMFKITATGKLSPTNALGIITGSKSFQLSKASIESVWFGEGEPLYHDDMNATEDSTPDEEREESADEEEYRRVLSLSADAESFSLLTEAETALLATKPYRWWGDEYLEWVQTRLKHFNKPYHVAGMWAALSVIASPWGKVPLAGSKPTDCNLYFNTQGASSTGKTEAQEFSIALIDAVYGTDHSPVIGDIQRLSSLALHRQLILRDNEPSMIYGDEIQTFFKGLQQSQWQAGIMGDVSSHYGGNVSPKLTLNDKEISGKRAKTLFTTYLTGIATAFLEAVSLDYWTSGFFYRFLWGFGNPRVSGEYGVKMESAPTSYTDQMDDWAKEFKRVGALQEIKWGAGRIVAWDEDAVKRIEELRRDIDLVTQTDPLYDEVFVNANGRFFISIMKCATIVAMIEAAETVSLRHVLIALQYAGPWHRSMVLAVGETAKEPFEREVDRCLAWIRRNAIRQVGKEPTIQRASVMRRFKPNEIAERLLRQLTEEGWLIRSGDTYQVVQGDE